MSGKIVADPHRTNSISKLTDLGDSSRLRSQWIQICHLLRRQPPIAFTHLELSEYSTSGDDQPRSNLGSHRQLPSEGLVIVV